MSSSSSGTLFRKEARQSSASDAFSMGALPMLRLLPAFASTMSSTYAPAAQASVVPVTMKNAHVRG
jgi:hypothetical protein